MTKNLISVLFFSVLASFSTISVAKNCDGYGADVRGDKTKQESTEKEV